MSAHEQRALTLMAARDYAVVVWDGIWERPIDINSRPSRLTWECVLGWLHAGTVYLSDHAEYTDGGMVYGVYSITDEGRRLICGNSTSHSEGVSHD